MTFLIEYGYLLLFALIFLDQLGLPLPSIPVVLGAGALAGTGQMNLTAVIAVSVLACVPADLVWFYIGRTRGAKVLKLLCRISLEPDYCVHRTQVSFDRLGSWTLALAKFVPGLQTIAPPMAGLTGMPVARFLALDALGATLWSALIACIGYLFSDELTEIAAHFVQLGGLAAAIVFALIAVFLLVKTWQRFRFLRGLRMRQLLPREIHTRLAAGEPTYIIDLRHRLDFNALPYMIPGAVRIPMEKIDEHQQSIPRDQDIVLYCS